MKFREKLNETLAVSKDVWGWVKLYQPKPPLKHHLAACKRRREAMKFLQPAANSSGLSHDQQKLIQQIRQAAQTNYGKPQE